MTSHRSKKIAHQKILYLPVFYTLLDPTRIPALEELKSLQPHTTTRIACASVSLNAIMHLEPKSAREIGPTLWPRVWPWIYFMHEHCEYLPDTIALPEFAIYNQLLALASQISDPSSAPDLIPEIRGFRIILAKAWAHLPQVKESQALESSLGDVAAFIGSLEFAVPVHFAEIIEDNFRGKSARLAFLYAVSGDLRVRSLYKRSLWKHCVNGIWFRHYFLLAHKSSTDSACTAIFDLLKSLLNAPLGYRWLTDAIEAGLLRAITTVAIRFGPALDSHLRYLLKELLPDGMVYYHVVAAIDEVLVEVEDICYGEEYQTLEIFQDWASFIELAERRVHVKAQMNGKAPKTCDNLEVCASSDSDNGLVLNRAGIADELKIGLITDDAPGVIHYIINAIAESPSSQISVRPLGASPITDTRKETGLEWKNLLSRVHGRMQLHVMRVPEFHDMRRVPKIYRKLAEVIPAKGWGTYLWAIPLRGSDSRVHRGLRATRWLNRHAVADGYVICIILHNGHPDVCDYTQGTNHWHFYPIHQIRCLDRAVKRILGLRMNVYIAQHWGSPDWPPNDVATCHRMPVQPARWRTARSLILPSNFRRRTSNTGVYDGAISIIPRSYTKTPRTCVTVDGRPGHRLCAGIGT
ncbi:hypothetical protein K438DRAFT_1751213 [Mycena galopus ATCC 62051]|nr:hypothetical protein K438DRAFT_1751213 [Mycena galopus ATCC 62051]